MPVKFPDRALGKMLLRRRNVIARRQVRHHLLSDPTPVKQTRFRVRETPFEINDKPIVCRLLP